MKTAIYIEDGIVQLVLTPENQFERAAISVLVKEPVQAQLFQGSFYDCRGGWIRQSAYYPNGDHGFTSSSSAEFSIILRSGEVKDIKTNEIQQSDLGITASQL